MDTTEVLGRLARLGITARTAGDKLLLEPGSKVPTALLAEVRQHKADIVARLKCEISEKRVGDGQAPPLDRPPQTEQELRRLLDYLDDPIAFGQWFNRLMQQTDPAEE